MADFACLKILCKALKKREIFSFSCFLSSILFPSLCVSLLIGLGMSTNFTNANDLNNLQYFRTNGLFPANLKTYLPFS